MNSPEALKFAIVMSDPEFQKVVQAMALSKVRTPLYISEALLLMALFFFRTWKGRSMPSLLRRMAFQFWTLLVYLVLAAYVVPRMWLGPEYNRFLGMLKPLLSPGVARYWPW